MSIENKPSPVEKIKIASDGLRGSIQESLTDELTGAIREDDQTVIKFHGMYQQDNRDRREERAAKKLDRLYSFMIRLRLPGGFLTPAQWLATHDIAGAHSTGVIKITSRQTIQLHGIIRSEIRPTISSFNAMKLDSIATCGDINRNVTCSAHPDASPVHSEVFAYADKISTLLMPKTKAYYEIWLEDEKIIDKKEEEDPLYQDRYLPRKLKIAIAIPPNNDVDVFTNDIGLIAIIENNQLIGFNIAIGGGLGTTHGNAETYPRLGNVIGFADMEEKVLKAVYEIVTIQRDYGNRSDRKLSRLKYTVDKYGLDWYTQELEKRTGFPLQPAKPYAFTARGDEPGWAQNHTGKWFYTLLVENGRVLDDERMALKTALYQIAEAGLANIRFTANQNLIIGDVADDAKATVQAILEKHAVIHYNESISEIRRNAMACVALPTCPLALAEGQRYLPELISKIELLTNIYKITQEKIIIRMTGCPNGCARPFIAEVGFVGTGPGRYNMYLGGDHEGTRLNKLYKEQLAEPEILQELDQLFASFVNERINGEKFGDLPTVLSGRPPLFYPNCMSTNKLFPVFLQLEQLQLLMIGGGFIGMEKLGAVLSNSPATNIQLVAIAISDEIRQLAINYPNITLKEKVYDPSDLENIDLVIVAVNDIPLAELIRKDARQKRILINVADKPSLCDFYLGSVVQKGNLKVAISTNGKSPTVAKRLKEVLNEMLPDEMESLLENMQAIRNSLKGDFTEKVKQLNQITGSLVSDLHSRQQETLD